MITFVIGLVILFVGAALYGRFCERVFGPDDRPTPAITKQDGVDYVPMKLWKNSLINLLNIAGTGPILGPLQGILFGPIAFITIPIGNIIAGSVHDYFAGMICMRDGGLQMPNMIKKYSTKTITFIYQILCCFLLLLIATVFIYTPGDIVATQIFGFEALASDPKTWIIYGVIFVYYFIATVFPIDQIIGRIYPFFGAILLFSSLGIFIALFVKGYPLVELWDSWNYIGATTSVDYGDYFHLNHFIPIFFITVACGILSGFHSTQIALVSRTLEHEKHGRMAFYNMMVAEGFIAMVWAAGGMAVYNLGLQAADASLATQAIGVICKNALGPFGGIIALAGVIVLPITSGDTALRALRLSAADIFHIDQKTLGKRLLFSTIIFAIVTAILVISKLNSDGFQILWRYSAWLNQVLSLFAFLAIAVWMCETGKNKYIWMPLIPGGWYAFVTATYILNAEIGFHVPWTFAYIGGIFLACVYVIAIIRYGKKRAKIQNEN